MTKQERGSDNFTPSDMTALSALTDLTSRADRLDRSGRVGLIRGKYQLVNMCI